MALRAFSRPAVLEAIGDHGRIGVAERTVVAGVGPEPGGLGPARPRRERRQRRLIRKHALAGPDEVEDALGERLQVEADLAHPARHHRAADVDAVAGVDALLAVERQTVGILGDRDMSEQPLGGKSALDQPRRRFGLDDALAAGGAGIARAVGDDDAEAGGHHVEPFRVRRANDSLDRLLPRLTFADRDALAGSAGAGRRLRLDHHLYPLQMLGQRLAGTVRPLASGRRLDADRGRERGDPGLDFLKEEGLLPVDQRLGLAPKAGTLHRLQDGGEPLDAGVGCRLGGGKTGGLRLQDQPFRLEPGGKSR